MTEKSKALDNKFKGYLIGIFLSIISGIILGWAVPLLELAGTTGNPLSEFIEMPITNVLTHPLLYIAIILQLVGGLLNYFALSYLRAAIVTPIYGSIQIIEAVIVAQILPPLRSSNPWSNLYLAALSMIVVAIILISYSISKKPEKEVQDLLPQAPYIKTPEETINEGFSAVFKLLDINLMAPYGRIRHRWAMPGKKQVHPNVLESSYISLIWKLWMPEIAQEILEPFFDAQDRDGSIPSELNIFSKKYVIQSPIIVYNIITQNPSEEFIKKIYPKLKALYNWYYQNRRTKEGLFFWKYAEESGMSLSPRFGNKKDISHIIPVDLNVYILLLNKNLAQIAISMGLNDEEKEFEKNAEELTEKIQKNFWDSNSSMYHDWDSVKKEFIRILSLTNFTPIIARIPSEEQLNSLIAHLSDPAVFNTPMPFPTIAISDSKFTPEKWRGAVSINLAYSIIQGLKLYQKDELISELSLKLIRNGFLVWKDSGTFYEFYSPDPSHYQLNEKPCEDYIGSSGLLNTLLIEEIIGLQIESKTLTLCPRLPRSWQKRTISYIVPTKKMNLLMHYKETDEIIMELNVGARKEEFTIHNYSKKMISI